MQPIGSEMENFQVGQNTQGLDIFWRQVVVREVQDLQWRQDRQLCGMEKPPHSGTATGNVSLTAQLRLKVQAPASVSQHVRDGFFISAAF